MRKAQTTPPKFWNVAAQKDGIGTIDLFGEIIDINRPKWVDDLTKIYYTNADFKKDMAAMNGCHEITVNINSAGGDYFLGVAIHNTLRALAAGGTKIKTVIQGAACSAAAVIFAAGDERLVYPGSVLMIHGVSCYVDILGILNIHAVNDKIAELRKLTKAMDAMNDGMAAIYAEICNMDQAEAKKMIDDNAERWMSAADALQLRFATGMAAEAADLRMVACANADTVALYSNGRLLSDHFRAPQNALALGITTAAEPPARTANTNPENMSTNPPKPAEISAEEQQRIANEAVAADRKRIAAIDAAAAKLPGVVDAAFIESAKYGSDTTQPMTVAEFHAALIERVDPAKIAAANYAETRRNETQPNNSVTTSPAAVNPPAKPDAIASFTAKLKENPNLR